MATKKTTTNSKPEKQYLVLDGDEDMVAYGNMDEVIDRLKDYEDTDDEADEISFEEWINQCTIYELMPGKKLKYTPAKYEIK